MKNSRIGTALVVGLFLLSAVASMAEIFSETGDCNKSTKIHQTMDFDSGKISIEGTAMTNSSADIAAACAGSTSALASNKMYFGNASGVANAKTVSGVVVTTTNGVFSFSDADLDVYAATTPGIATNLLKLATYAHIRTNLNVVAGVDVQAYDADLSTLASAPPSANGFELITNTYANMVGLIAGATPYSGTYTNGIGTAKTNVVVVVNGVIKSVTTSF